jgi:acyl-CoA thioester hydrolase
MRVTYAACTIGNHVYYGRYLDFLEAARGEFFRELGHPLLRLQEEGVAFPVVECRLNFRGAARYDDVLTVETWVAALGRVRVDFGYRILRTDGAVLLEGVTRHACTRLDERPSKVPAALHQALVPYVAHETSALSPAPAP